ncbi:MAG: hypothetical protein JRD04_12750 [Deltaproteobacteria bacterium]|nr:hypothetical protein [Deltaproteobacteria bacterium]
MSGVANLKPYSKLVVTRVPDGEGGFTNTEDATQVVYLNVEYNAEEMTAICKVETALTVKDLVIIESAKYEVLQVLRQDGGQTKLLKLERQDKPLEPVMEEAS